MRKKILTIAILLGILFTSSFAYAQIGGGIGSPSFFKKVGDNIQLLKDTWTLKVENAEITNLSIGGVATGEIDMDGNDITNGGEITFSTSTFDKVSSTIGIFDQVGIGTTTPDQALTVAGNVGMGIGDYLYFNEERDDYIYSPANDFIQFRIDNRNNLSLSRSFSVFNDDGGDIDTRIEGDTDDFLFFTDASTDRIGIGTSTPATKLNIYQDDVDNAIRINGAGAQSSNYFDFYVDNAGYSNIKSSLGFRFTGDTDNIAFIDDGGANGFRMYDDIPFSFGSSASGRFRLGRNDASGKLRLTTNELDSTDTLMTFTTSGEIGIGNDSPDDLLTVGSLSDNKTNSVTVLTASGQRSTFSMYEDTYGIGARFFYDGLDNIFKIQTGDTLGGQTTRLAIDRSTGNVGIGTSTPAYDLQVAGGTTTSTMACGTVDKPCCHVSYDTDGGISYGTTLNGVMTWSDVSCE